MAFVGEDRFIGEYPERLIASSSALWISTRSRLRVPVSSSKNVSVISKPDLAA